MDSPFLFERPAPPGWVYPCTLDDIRDVLRRLPGKDIQGLWAIGFVHEKQSASYCYAKYRWHDHPVVHIFSVPEDLTLRLPAGTKRRHLTHGRDMEAEYGMRREQVGARWVSTWDRESLRHFTLEDVLLHEIGHHVSHKERLAQGLVQCPGTGVCEQFAEHYALRRRRALWGKE